MGEERGKKKGVRMRESGEAEKGREKSQGELLKTKRVHMERVGGGVLMLHGHFSY